ncbi:MAG: class I SAM-dependent methyltransferase, partial [Geodermatophilales bacterium]|nr:class I SAM-dependent methyltransferase [Geodermatophilales bacterium]
MPADPLPDDAVAALHWLQGPDGAAAVERAGRLQAEGVDLLPG